MSLHARRPLLKIGQLLFQLLQPLLRRGVALLLQGRPFDLELFDPAFHLVDLHRHRVDLDPQARCGLVDQVDRLVGKEPPGDVPVREDGRCHQRRVLDPNAVVDLVSLLQPPEDGDGVRGAGLADEDRLEPALQGRVLLHVLAIFVERGGPDGPELAASQHRLQHVAGVDRAFRSAGTDHRVELVDERDDLAGALGDLAKNGLEPLLELSAVLGPGDQRADVEGHHPLVLEPLGNVPGHDALGQPLDDGGLAHARLADQDGVVLRSSRQDLDDPADLVVTPDDRIELPLSREIGEVATVALEGLVLLLRVLIGHPLPPADLHQRRKHLLAGDPRLLQEPGHIGGAFQQGQEEMLGRNVLVRECRGLREGTLQDVARPRGQVRLLLSRPRVDLGDSGQQLVRSIPQGARRLPELLKKRVHHALGVREQCEQDVRGLDLLLVAIGRQHLRGLQGFL